MKRISRFLLTCEVLFLVLTVIFICLNFRLIYNISFVVFLFSGILGMFLAVPENKFKYIV